MSNDAGNRNIIVFGDDWQSHISTTQHLINHLDGNHRIIWIDSIGMRSPELSFYDLTRVARKALRLISSSKNKQHVHKQQSLIEHVQPKVLPWHSIRFVNNYNRRYINRLIDQLIEKHNFFEPVILASNPVVALYLNEQHCHSLTYLRLDDYEKYGGVDPELAIHSEQRMLSRAKMVFYTAQSLKPENAMNSRYLPQGVDVENFKLLPPCKSENKTLGFFGLMEPSRYDFELIIEVAKLNPDWVLEFIGPMTYVPDTFKSVDNIRLLPAVDYQQLSEATTHWSLAWIPYRVNDLTRSINPLKLREYLSLGHKVMTTELPEVKAIDADISIIESALEATQIMQNLPAESDLIREFRHKAMHQHSWVNRSQELIDYLPHLHAV